MVCECVCIYLYIVFWFLFSFVCFLLVLNFLGLDVMGNNFFSIFFLF